MSRKAIAGLASSCFQTGLAAIYALSILGILTMALCLWSLFEFVSRMSRKITPLFLQLAVFGFMALSVLLQLLWVVLFFYALFVLLGAYPGVITLVTVSALALAFVTAATANYHERRMQRHRIAEWL